MEYPEMREMCRTHQCTQCGDGLTIIWEGSPQVPRLVCRRDHAHEGYTRGAGPSELVARGRGDELAGVGGQKEAERAYQRGSVEISLMSTTDLANKKQLAAPEITALIAWAQAINLNAYLGHVCLYQSKPYVTADGYYYLLRKIRPGVAIGCRPASAADRQDYSVSDTDYMWIAEAWEDNVKMPWIGVGIVTKAEIERKSKANPDHYAAPVVHDHPQRLAEKRAEWQLLRKIIPLEADV
jgi:hypothetical protein